MAKFHNTIDIAGKSLKQAKKKVNEQEILIMQYYMQHPYAMPTPWQLHDWLKSKGHDLLITSVRRTLTDLTDEGKLVKSHVQFKGPKGQPNHAWMLNLKNRKLKVKTEKPKANAHGKVRKPQPKQNQFQQQTLSI